MRELPRPLTKQVTRGLIARYAAATGDYNLQHLDEDHARRVGLPSVIAHGMLSFGYVSQLLTDWCDGDPGRVDRIRLRFVRPVFPHDELTVCAANPTETAGGIRVEVLVTRGDEVVSCGDATVR